MPIASLAALVIPIQPVEDLEHAWYPSQKQSFHYFCCDLVECGERTVEEQSIVGGSKHIALARK